MSEVTELYGSDVYECTACGFEDEVPFTVRPDGGLRWQCPECDAEYVLDLRDAYPEWSWEQALTDTNLTQQP